MTESDISKLRLFFGISTILSFVLGVYVGMSIINTTVDETEYTNTIQEIEIPIGKLSKETIKYLKP